MSKSSTLRAVDLRTLFQLVGECRELGDDPFRWWRHLLAGLSRLNGGEFCVAGEIGDGRQPSRYDLGTVDIGADNGFNRAAWLRGLVEFRDDAFKNPHLNAYFDRATPGEARPRADYVSDREWYSCFSYQGILSALGADHGLFCLLPVSGTTDDHCCLWILRHFGARDFNGRECAVTAEAMAMVAPLIGGPLSRLHEPSPADLPPLARRVLRCLLEGNTDKQAASRLGITRHTVNQYAKVIFRHFGVRSRPELLAQWVRRGWGARFAWASPDQ